MWPSRLAVMRRGYDSNLALLPAAGRTDDDVGIIREMRTRLTGALGGATITVAECVAAPLDRSVLHWYDLRLLRGLGWASGPCAQGGAI